MYNEVEKDEGGDGQGKLYERGLMLRFGSFKGGCMVDA
jgi:hypothetical protein